MTHPPNTRTTDREAYNYDSYLLSGRGLLTFTNISDDASTIPSHIIRENVLSETLRKTVDGKNNEVLIDVVQGPPPSINIFTRPKDLAATIEKGRAWKRCKNPVVRAALEGATVTLRDTTERQPPPPEPQPSDSSKWSNPHLYLEAPSANKKGADKIRRKSNLQKATEEAWKKMQKKMEVKPSLRGLAPLPFAPFAPWPGSSHANPPTPIPRPPPITKPEAGQESITTDITTKKRKAADAGNEGQEDEGTEEPESKKQKTNPSGGGGSMAGTDGGAGQSSF
ncbi:hypothetical protein HK097_007363 [Rhizophlyctis rosea]|uniref:Uncharacterized protein n=1 Tax=Rhizophlyctis rosea TaxID=64517 RepID=A0AAD5X1N4_9FUNG|nr:hypothetical protein HK097_007363 [Rhizophlyctis rosea]